MILGFGSFDCPKKQERVIFMKRFCDALTRSRLFDSGIHSYSIVCTVTCLIVSIMPLSLSLYKAVDSTFLFFYHKRLDCENTILSPVTLFSTLAVDGCLSKNLFLVMNNSSTTSGRFISRETSVAKTAPVIFGTVFSPSSQFRKYVSLFQPGIGC